MTGSGNPKNIFFKSKLRSAAQPKGFVFSTFSHEPFNFSSIDINFHCGKGTGKNAFYYFVDGWRQLFWYTVFVSMMQNTQLVSKFFCDLS